MAKVQCEVTVTNVLHREIEEGDIIIMMYHNSTTKVFTVIPVMKGLQISALDGSSSFLTNLIPYRNRLTYQEWQDSLATPYTIVDVIPHEEATIIVRRDVFGGG